MNEEIVKTMTKMNFKQVGKFFTGKIQNVYFKICDSEDENNFLLISLSVEDSLNRNQLFFYLDTQRNISVDSYSFNNSSLAIKAKNDESSLISLLNGIADCIIQNNLKCKCEHCSNTENLAIYSAGAAPFLLCSTCLHNFNNYLEEEKQRPEHYLVGFLCSLLGAVIGSLLWVFLGVIGFVASIAGALIAYGAFTGYKIAKGKISVAGIILNILAIVFAFMFAETLGLYIDVVKEFKTLISFSDFIYVVKALFEDTDFVLEVIKDLGIGLIFAVLGSYRTIKENIQKVKSSKNLTINKVDL